MVGTFSLDEVVSPNLSTIQQKIPRQLFTSANPPHPPSFSRREELRDAIEEMMQLLYWLRQLYSLDTLDTRFTASADTPTRVAADTRPPSKKDGRAKAIANGASPSKWNTPEFYFYYVVHLIVVPMMFKTAMDVSQGERETSAQLTSSARSVD